MKSTERIQPDIILIGAGIMSATLGVFLKELHPNYTIHIYEKMDAVALESSDAWNNAGTGHSAFCELNYTPQTKDGTIDISKALKIASSFEVSKQFWSYLIQQSYIASPEAFIHSIPHMSFVWGEENVSYLKKRFDALKQTALFEEMQYSEDWEQLKKWIPLVMNGRNSNEKVAATRMEAGTDVNFGALTRALFKHLQTLEGVTLYLNHEVRDIEKQADGHWTLKVKDLTVHEKREVTTTFVFIGAGGGSLPLLEKSDIKEAEGFGGFPISGQFLKCTNETIIAQHEAKVYGKATVGSPPMSVPHLDTRIIDGKKALLFGPYAGFSTKFLKHGSYLDLTESIEFDNIFPMLSAGWHNMPLTKYLIHQVRQSHEDRVNALREYFPNAKNEDWELVVAGQRVQVIKKDRDEGGVLEFGTEIVSSADGSLVALLGASPGASTSVSIILDVLQICFKKEMQSPEWQTKLKQMIPTYGLSLSSDSALCKTTRKHTSEALHLNTSIHTTTIL
jgi:malate dehydrogenase (quinone)